MWIILFILIGLVRAYDLNQAQIGTWLSGAAYCNKTMYSTMKVGGPAKGFLVQYPLYDPIYDLQGFVGYMRNTRTIYVVFRGSASLQNWIADLQINRVSYNTYRECNATIHDGFYKSTMHIKLQVYFVLDWLRYSYPTYKIIITGHSYGAAISQILAMELLGNNIPVEVYNYGQPRIGDENYAMCVNKILGGKYWRFTHNKDIVPHIPPIKGFGYMHSCGEVFEDEKGWLRQCSMKICEDPTCADKYLDKETNVNDHLTYLGHRLSCEESVL